jgi:hypothetical protein
MTKAAAPKKTEKPTTAPRTPSKRTSVSKASFDDIQRRAFFLYVERGQNGGSELDDWFRAESELSSSKSSGRRRAA